MICNVKVTCTEYLSYLYLCLYSVLRTDTNTFYILATSHISVEIRCMYATQTPRPQVKRSICTRAYSVRILQYPQISLLCRVSILYCTRYKVQLHPHIILHLCTVLRICIPIPKSGPGANEITYPPASTGLKRRLKWTRGQAVRVGE